MKLMILAKNLLCEIETAIDNTRLRLPPSHTREEMNAVLRFRNNKKDPLKFEEIDDLDTKFAKVRFHEYLHSLQRIMKRPRNTHLRRKDKNGLKRKRKTPLATTTLIPSTNSESLFTNAIDNIPNDRRPLLMNPNRLKNKHRNRLNGENKRRRKHNQFVTDENGKRVPRRRMPNAADRPRNRTLNGMPRRHRRKNWTTSLPTIQKIEPLKL